MRLDRFARVVVFSAFAVVSSPAAQTVADADVTRLRTLFFQRNYEVGVLDGAKFSAAADRPEPRAWYVLNLARYGREDDAVALARQMTAAAADNAWSWLALAAALNYKGDHVAEAIDAGAKAFQLLPEHPDVIWIRALTLAAEPKRRQEAVAFIDAQRSRLKNPAELLTVKAYALYSDSFGPPRDEAKLKAAFDVFEEAQRLDPTNVNAFYLHGNYLNGARRSDEAYPLLKKALALAPDSTAVHQALWSAINGSQKLTAAEKQKEIEADMTAFLGKHGKRPGALHAVSSMARDLKLVDKQRELEESILREFADSPEAEWILAYRWRDSQRTKASGESPEYRKMLSAYIARPRHYHKGLLGEAYRNLFFVLVKDPAVPADEMTAVADGMLKYETTNLHQTYARAAVELADQKVHLSLAERIARDAPRALKGMADRQKSAFKSDGEWERNAGWLVGMGHDALGWVLFAQGRLADAEKELLRSHELNRESRDNLHHLGRFYEAKGDFAKAEEYYVKGIAVQGMGTNPSEAALRALFAKRSGNADGFDTYLTDLRERDRIRRRDKILAERLAKSEPAPAFNLKTLDGSRATLDSLKGKIVVINFWGIWCGPCVAEMPDVQKLYDKYKGDKDVAIITIDNDQNPDDVPPWMKEKGYTFPVLLDDGYVSKTGITAFPTTWFLDREGRRVFVKVGWSEKLVEEFSWRIEAIR